MNFKKAFGKIYDVQYTAAEQKAMDISIQKQLAEMNRKNANEIDAIILWTLHEEFGFGPDRLRRMYDCLINGVEALNLRYETDYGERIWLYTKMLKDYGVDIAAWNAETERKMNKG